MLQLIYNLSFLIFTSLQGAELGINHPDEVFLENVEQLTFFEMGFAKAGEAYFSPDGETIIFQAVPIGETGYQIFTMDLKTRSIHQISQNRGTCTCAFFRPDGEKIIYAASPETLSSPKGEKYKWDLTPYMNIYEANCDGSNPLALTEGPFYHAECAFSPDGSQIVYASNEDGSMNIYTMKADGSDVRKLTDTKDCYNGGPFFSPDGKKIIFRADREEANLLQIYMMDSDGSNLIQFTCNECVNWAPFWHPSQEFIAFTTSLHGHYNYEIYLQNLSTLKFYRVTYHPAFDGLPTFNSDGSKMMWTSKRGNDHTCQIFIADFKLPKF